MNADVDDPIDPLDRPLPIPSTDHATHDAAASIAAGQAADTDDSNSLHDRHDEVRLLSRSPHPYHHRNTDLLHAAHRFDSSPPGSRHLLPHSSAPADLDASSVAGRPGSSDLKDAASCKEPNEPSSFRDSMPASDSGTEADDEHFLKGLPAPRAKPHKGLRGMNEPLSLSGLSTPLMSPAFLRSDANSTTGGGDTDAGGEDKAPPKVADDQSRPTAISPQVLQSKLRREKRGKHTSDDVLLLDQDRRYGKGSAQRSRRRREIVRRSTELLLLVALGSLLFSHPDARPLILLWRREIQAAGAVGAALTALYPVRLAIWARRQHPSDPSSSTPAPPLSRLLAVPAAFDPAPLFYPPVIPVFVALLLATPTLPAAPLLNLILSICALPKRLIPLSAPLEIYSPVQWALSCLPMAVAQCYHPLILQQLALPDRSATPATPFAYLSAESATLLYPLHQTLSWLLHDLTTTSLLPAELQLLSTGLVNVLLLAKSPQAVILQAVLWGGAVGLLVTSGTVIRWGITLARVPRWRFRRESPNEPTTFPSIMAGLAFIWSMVRSPRRTRLEMMFGSGDSLDSEDDSLDSDSSALLPQLKKSFRSNSKIRKSNSKNGKNRRQILQAEVFRRTISDSDVQAVRPTQSAIKHSPRRPHYGKEVFEAEKSPAEDDHPPVDSLDGTSAAAAATAAPEYRRFSLPTDSAAQLSSLASSRPTAHEVAQGIKRVATTALSRTLLKAHTTPSGRRKRSASSSVRAFFSLTHAQAVRRKWLYAGYVYFCVFAIIMVGIRSYVGRYALDGNEPFGWALGYLLGDLPGFRLEVIKAQLEYWVCLPARTDPTKVSLSFGWLEYVRQVWIGPANTRLLLIGYWAAILVVGLGVVLQLAPIYEVDTRRKVFHFMMVGMLLPATFVDPTYAALALSLVLAVFLLLDLLRASQLPPLSRPLATFLTPYVDGRDLRGPVVISHIFLLIGCAIPLWLSLAATPRGKIVPGGANNHSTSVSAGTAGPSQDRSPFSRWDIPTRDASMVAGVVCVGLGDAAASLIGRRWGRRKWLWGGGKSLEGSVAFAAAVFAGLMGASLWLRVGGWPVTGEHSDPAAKASNVLMSSLSSISSLSSVPPPPSLQSIYHGLRQAWSTIWDRSMQTVPRAGACAMVASLTEAVLTGGNDNVVVPVILWTCVKSLSL